MSGLASGADTPLYVPRFTSWAPGLNGQTEWLEWAQGKRNIGAVKDSPGLEYTPPPVPPPPEPAFPDDHPGNPRSFTRRGRLLWGGHKDSVCIIPG
ncbi:hypothetical protein FACS1894137_11330 [Spirochaetia bacterium]|nr:hypothetical protein FACS1894137_11330 [Spirochaetia bacterium]